MVVFALGFSSLIVLVSHYYLYPAMEAAREATTHEKAGLRAYSTLLLAVMLFILLVGLSMVYRAGHWFRTRRSGEARTKTEYVDAWAEAGRRMKTPDEHE